MLDLFGIVVSSVIMFLVILRAIQLDSTQPWFRPPKSGADSSGLRLRPSRGGGEGRRAGVPKLGATRGAAYDAAGRGLVPICAKIDAPAVGRHGPAWPGHHCPPRVDADGPARPGHDERG